jgi:hypothetical protein
MQMLVVSACLLDLFVDRLKRHVWGSGCTVDECEGLIPVVLNDVGGDGDEPRGGDILRASLSTKSSADPPGEPLVLANSAVVVFKRLPGLLAALGTVV